MRFPLIRNVLLVGVVAVVLSACLTPEQATVDSNTLRPNVNTNFNSNAANANSNTVQDDGFKLDTLINLPFKPVENVWRKDKVVVDGNSNRVEGSVDYKLTAVLKFSENDTKALIERVREDASPAATELETETWFPAELIAKSETSGNSTIKGTIYGAKDFVKSPYNVGSLIRINDTEYFILRLQNQ